ncbi:MAG TPA: NnrU family protein [Nevskiaceae bacterium]|nr:NnrU family protein [Nevskiaceae bacterium]
MSSLIAAALFFVGIHVFISGTALRGFLVRRLGEKIYLAFFSALSAGGLAWLIWAFTSVRVVVPTGLAGWRWFAVVLNFIALVLVSFGVLSRSPTAVGGARLLDEDGEPARGMHRVTRHPMLWGFAIWAAVHMVFNPQSPALIFFGTFLVLALTGPLLIDAKRAAVEGERWKRYLSATSNVPFAAIFAGRNRMAWDELVAFPLLAAAVITELLVLNHAAWFGVPAL